MTSKPVSELSDYLRLSQAAQVYVVAKESPVDPAPRLSARLGCQVLFKREDLQPVFSFKLRGAYNKLASLDQTARQRGVVTSSAGNHAQGVALAAQSLGVEATIVMPITTPSIKVDAVRHLGGTVVLHGDGYDDAYGHAIELANQHNLTFIHPFDDPKVIAGQGTIGLELVKQLDKPPHAVFIPIGGGGLAAGVGAVIKQLLPDVRIIGVEPVEASAMAQSLEAGSPIVLDKVGMFADGVAVKRVGDETFRVCQQVLDDVVLVDTDEICAAIKDIFEDSRVVLEPAGALAVAGLKKFAAENSMDANTTLVAINSGANVNFDRLRHISERAEIGEHREAILAVEIPERPGAFREFCEALGDRNVTEFNYRFTTTDSARIFVGVSLTHGLDEAAATVEELRNRGYRVTDLSTNELAKIHVRHMVGGLATGLTDERLFRFEFPERPGALSRFLNAIGERWNISLFHYRNHGSDYGRVLAGIQVPEAQDGAFGGHLEQLGYFYSEETHNPAYTLFLQQG
jgi:threonine dehydratase